MKNEKVLDIERWVQLQNIYFDSGIKNERPWSLWLTEKWSTLKVEL